MDTCIFMAEFLYHSPETVKTLLISYTPIQNVFGVKYINRFERTFPSLSFDE